MNDSPTLSRKTMLVVEDEPIVRIAIIDALSVLEDYEIVEAGDGAEALRIINRDSPEVVILDLLIPKFGGIDLLELLHERDGPRSDRKIIVISALTTSGLADRIKQLGVAAIVTKPFHLLNLVKTVREVVTNA